MRGWEEAANANFGYSEKLTRNPLLPSSQLPSCLINHYSRYMLGLSGVPAVIMLIGLLFMPESPRWLVSKGKVEKAKKVLQRIRNSDDVDEEIYDITQTIQKQRLGKKLLVC
jgi:hypothetical protein